MRFSVFMKKKKETIEDNNQVEEVKEIKDDTLVMENSAIAENSNLSEFDHKKLDKDMKYHGPLSYRHLRLIGWLMLALSFVSMILGAVYTLKVALAGDPEAVSDTYSKLATIFSFLSALPLPLFLIANFAIILQSKNNYKKLLIGYGKLVLIIYLAFVAIYYHYIIVLLMRLGDMNFVEAREVSIELFTDLGKQGGLVVNVFVDLFCCALIMFFIDYTPKTRFQGKKIIIFRLLALLPILYEVMSAVFMGLLGMNKAIADFKFSLPPELLPLLGKKPIGMIISFVLICLFIKIREKIYIKRGGTKEGYELYLKTNRDSFNLSLFMAIIFLVVAIVDIIIFAAPAINCLLGPHPEEAETLMDVMQSFTLGKSACLLLVIPFVLLFSYSKQHKNPKLDKLLPIIGIGLVAFALIESIFFAIIL